MDLKQQALELHSTHRGKVEVASVEVTSNLSPTFGGIDPEDVAERCRSPASI